MTVHEKTRLVLAIVVVIGFFTLIGLTIFVPIAGAEIEIVDMLIGALIAAFTIIVAYYFKRDN